MTTTKAPPLCPLGTVTQANPIIIWPGATIDWAGRMAPFSQESRYTISLSGAWANRRRISGLTDTDSSKDTRLGGFMALLGALFSFAGDLEVEA
jgi:hypothetical protein